MDQQLQTPIARFMLRGSKRMAQFAGCLSCIVLLGYSFHIVSLIRIVPTLKGMSPLTAFGLLAVSATMSFESLKGRKAAQVTLGMVPLCLGAGVLLARALWGKDLPSLMIAWHLFGVKASDAGSMSSATATCLVLLGTSALSRERRVVPDAAAAAVVAISGIALLGYAYDVHDLYALPIFDAMALHTAFALFALALASIAARAESGSLAVVASEGGGGVATRRQLAFTLLPPIAGWVLLRASNDHQIGPAAAMAFLVTFTILPLAGLILRDGKMLDELEQERRAKDQLSLALSRDLQDQLARQAKVLMAQRAEQEKAESAVNRIQRMDAIGQLTGGISHDFNNLLMVIGGNMELIARCLPKEHQARGFIDNVVTAAERGRKLTGQLLAFSRLQRLENKKVLIDHVLRNARQLVGNALGPSIAFELELDASGKVALIDPDQLELAILNLAVNARDAMPSGGRLTVTSSIVRRACRQSDAEGYCLSIKVVDTGEGMPANVVARAVEPFFTTKETGKGTGLGLSQVYGFVSQSSGDVQITSAVGQGTTIELILPIAGSLDPLSMVPLGEGPKRAEEYDGARKLILVIDDDDDVRAVLVEALLGVGYKVIEAKDGQTGLDYLRTLRPAAAVIDFLMPGLNGAEVARRAQLAQPDLPIVFVSGYYDTAALNTIAGAVVLKKPFEIEGLHRAVASVLH